MNGALIGGALIGAVGVIIMVATWPSTEGGLGGTTETGSVVGFVAASLLAWAGSMWLPVGLIGHGARLGREASPLPSGD